MNTGLTSSPLTYRIVRILVHGKVRFLLQKHTSLVPSLSLSIYESYLSEKHSSHNSVYTTLNKCLYLWAWADLMDIDLDYLLLHGETLETKQVRLFSVWLKQRISKSSGKRIDATVINSTLVHVSIAIRWFAEQFASFECSPIEREIKLAMYLKLIKQRFSDQRIKKRKKKCADDLTEDEIKKIFSKNNSSDLVVPDLKLSLISPLSILPVKGGFAMMMLYWLLWSKLLLKVSL